MGYLDGTFGGYNYGKLVGLFLGGSLGYNVGKVLDSDEGVKVGLSYGKVIGTILGNVDGITLRIDVGTELGSLDGYLYGSNDGKFEGLLLSREGDQSTKYNSKHFTISRSHFEAFIRAKHFTISISQ